jgi:enterochelin esterase family protein
MNIKAIINVRFILICFGFLSFSLIVKPQESVSFVSPEIHDDSKVTFRFFDPNAKAVVLTGDFLKTQSVSLPMEKDNQGIWQITVGPLIPCIYSYSFTADGLKVLDQDNGWVKYGRSTTDNMFLVPGGEEADILMPSSVPHGEVRMVYYTSKILNKVKRMHIYFPPGYNESKEKYPVLYLLHGGGDHDDGWI